MSNMSYCRFENTLGDLRDCQEHLFDDLDNLNESEKWARDKLIKVCFDIVDELGEGYFDNDDDE